MRGAACIGGLLVVAGLLLAPAAGAEMYRYVDDEGNVHVADHPSKLPEPERARALPADTETDAGAVSVVPSGGDGSPDRRRSRASSGRREAEPRCQLGVRNRKRDLIRDEYVYTGQVVNVGTGRAAGIRLELVNYDRAGERIGATRARLDRSTLDPGESTLFRIVIEERDRDEEKRDEAFARSAFDLDYARCVAVSSSASSR